MAKRRVVRLAFGQVGAQGQHRLDRVERLDAALLVDAEGHRLVQRFEIEPDDVAESGDELGGSRQLEARRTMRLQAMLVTDIPNGLLADASGARHRAGASVGGAVSVAVTIAAMR